MSPRPAQLDLSHRDQQMLCGAQGPCREWAMSMLVRVAHCMGASRLIDISQAHLVGSYYGGPGDMALVKKLASQGAKVSVPTTLNASSADLQNPGLYPSKHPDVEASCNIVKAYQGMGCQVALTCAPYHLPVLPTQGEAVAWAESNAIVYANAVLGARTNKTYQYLDLCAALTGRMPEYGYYLAEERRATRVYRLRDVPSHWLVEDAFYQLLGICLGWRCGGQVPVIEGLPATVTEDQLRGLGAAAASSGNLAMFHAVGLTPEAPTLDIALMHRAPARVEEISAKDIRRAREQLNQASDENLAAICLGTPHYSEAEFTLLLNLLAGRQIARDVDCYVSTSRHVLTQIHQSGVLNALKMLGVQVVADTCTYHGMLLKDRPGTVLTSSGKWAYYAPGNLNVAVRFERLDDCIESAVRGEVWVDDTFWF